LIKFRLGLVSFKPLIVTMKIDLNQRWMLKKIYT